MKQPLHPKVTFQNSLYAPRFTPGTDGQIEWFTHDASWYTQLLLYSSTGSTTRAHWPSTKQEGPLSSSSSNVTFTHDSLSQRRVANECVISITTGCLGYYKCVSAAGDRYTLHYICLPIKELTSILWKPLLVIPTLKCCSRSLGNTGLSDWKGFEERWDHKRPDL